MNTWIIPNNSKDYDIQDGMSEYGDEIEWTKTLPTTNIAIGDIVYLYITAPVKSLTMKFTVIESNVISPKQRHRNNGVEEANSWFKLKFQANIKPIAYETLFDNGVVNGYIQAARLLKPNQEVALKGLVQER